jgi:hypothetical protein
LGFLYVQPRRKAGMYTRHGKAVRFGARDAKVNPFYVAMAEVDVGPQDWARKCDSADMGTDVHSFHPFGAYFWKTARAPHIRLLLLRQDEEEEDWREDV